MRRTARLLGNAVAYGVGGRDEMGGGTSSALSYQNTKETQVLHPDKTLWKLKWYILSKHYGDSSGTSCHNA